MFVPGKPFQPSLLSMSKAGVKHQNKLVWLMYLAQVGYK
jgi:hypothetical protein